MNLDSFTPILFGAAVVALICEVVALYYCAFRNIPFGGAFGATVFVQISIPAALLATVFAWEYFSPSVPAADSFGGRGWELLFGSLAAAVVATLAAGALGVRRILFDRSPHAKTRNAEHGAADEHAPRSRRLLL